VLGWRDVPVVPDLVGDVARACMPVFRQLFVAAAGSRLVGVGLERVTYALRRRAERELARLPRPTRRDATHRDATHRGPGYRTGPHRPRPHDAQR